MTDADDGQIVPQRAVLVLPTTAEFDSRTYRIASALVARGHTVTVLARLRAGLPATEDHPSGYRIVRVPVAAIEGAPVPGVVRLGRVAVRRLHAWRTKTPYRPVPPLGAPPSSAAPAAAPTSRGAGDDDAPAPSSTATASLPRRVASSVVRRLAIPLTIRSQAAATRRVAPAADLYHGMAYMGIPIALDLGRRNSGKVVYDARDIYIDAANLARMPRTFRWLIGRAERRWARRADRVVTVNRPYAEVMGRRWGLELPLIVMNCAYRTDPPDPKPRRFHDALGLDPATRVVLYQGGFSRDRGIEQLIAAIPSIPDAVLVLLGYGSLQAELEAVAANPATGGRVRVLPAVPPTELLAWVASADVVAMPIQPTTLNHRLTTPNKLFEAIAVGVPVVASDLPGMAPTVREADAGLLVDPTDPVAIATACRTLLDEPSVAAAARRTRILAAAHATFNWETQLAVLLAEYERLTGKRW
ncbi:MAG TPA: glycosyltransferase [Candidatus Limnocylindrales bacterium]|nr:glycosyltransferase [Candidatus Limnocylindrales bacterium]